MILKGSQRSGARQLSQHLLNERDNDHVSVLEMRGFIADDLHGALAEAHAISKATRCKQFMFSLSLNPPQGAAASEVDFKRAADQAEERLGLSGQPRAIVIHEKENRRHAHVVWSRIDAAELKAINLPHFKTKLNALAKELYLEHGWELPEGMRRMGGKSPLNFTLEEWQQSKRLGVDPREIKEAFQSAFKQSDNLKALANALEERGYFLAKGNRRGFVALDVNGEVYSVPKYIGMKTNAFRAKMGDGGHDLPTVSQVSADLKQRLHAKLKSYIADVRASHAAERKPLETRRTELTAEHRAQRARLTLKQAERQQAEAIARATRLRTGLMGFVDKFSGRANAIRHQNEVEAYEGLRRDQRQRDQLVIDQMTERRGLQERLNKMRQRHVRERKNLHREIIQAVRTARDRHGDRTNEPRRDPTKRGFSLDR